MDQNQEHLKNLSEIRSLMERSSSFISLSGASGILSGLIGIITFVISYNKLTPFFVKPELSQVTPALIKDTILFFFILSALVLFITFLEVIYLTSRKASKKGLPIWDSSTKRLLVNLFIPLITGGLFCLILVYHEIYRLIPAVMLLFYGLALLNSSKYTLHDIKFLGISQLVLGLCASFWFEGSLWFWGIGFGVMNIVYGILMYLKYEK